MDEFAQTDIQQVDARVIEDEVMISASAFEVDMSGIQRDIAELTGAIDEALTVYGDLLVPPEEIGMLAPALAQNCERDLSRAIRNANELRLQLGREYRGPLNAANQRYKELMGPVEALRDLYKQRRLDYEAEEARRKLESLRERYEGLLPQVALPAEGQAEALVPFERIVGLFGEKWSQKGARLDVLERRIDEIAAQIEAGARRIEEAHPAHELEVKAHFWQTLDADAALARDVELRAVEERQAALEAKRAAEAAAREAAEAAREVSAALEANDAAARGAAAGEPGLAGTPETVLPGAADQPPSQGEAGLSSQAQERKPRVMLIDGATDDECRQIGALCKSLGITGVFKGERFYETVKHFV